MVNCKKVSELVTDFLEGRLSRLIQARIRFHMSWCKSCRNYVDQMKLTVKTLSKLPRIPVPADVHKELLDAFRRMKSEHSQGRFTP